VVVKLNVNVDVNENVKLKVERGDSGGLVGEKYSDIGVT
jgi:hypothetical protein